MLYIWKSTAYSIETLYPCLLLWPVWVMYVDLHLLRLRLQTFQMGEIFNFSQIGLNYKHISRLDTKPFLHGKKCDILENCNPEYEDGALCLTGLNFAPSTFHFWTSNNYNFIISFLKYNAFTCVAPVIDYFFSEKLDEGLFQISNVYLEICPRYAHFNMN